MGQERLGPSYFFIIIIGPQADADTLRHPRHRATAYRQSNDNTTANKTTTSHSWCGRAGRESHDVKLNNDKTLFPNGELNLLSPSSGCPLVADNRIFSFPLTCGCWRGTCRVGLLSRGGRRRGRGPGEACSRQCVAVRRSCAGDGPLPRAGAQLPVD